MKRMVARVCKTTSWIALVVVLLVGFLQTPPGKNLFASALSSMLSRSENLEIRIGKISGWIPANVQVDRVEIGDIEGRWLSARNLHCRWVVHELFGERIRLRSLGAEEIEFYRLPKSEPKKLEAKRKYRGRQRFEIEIDGLQVNRLMLDKGVAGVPLEYSVHSGGVALVAGELSGGVSVSGDAEGWVEFETSSADGSAKQLVLRGELDRMNHPLIGLDHLSGSGEATIDAKSVDARVVADMEKKGQKGRIASRLFYAAHKLRLEEFQFDSKNYSATGDMTLGFPKGEINVAVDASLVDSTTNKYTLQGAADIATSNKTWSADIHSLEIQSWDVVALSLSGKLGRERVDLRGELREFDVANLPVFGISNFTGKASGLFSINGSLESPQVVAGLQVKRFSGRKQALDELPKLDFRIAAGVADGTFRAATTLTNFSRGFLSADLAMPCGFSISPFCFKPDLSKMQGRLDADLDLRVFNGLAVLDSQHVEGVLKTRLALKDRIPSGFVKMEGGAYEHYDWGIMFHDFSAELAATPDGFVFRKAKATDGASGRLELTGGMLHGLLDLQLELSKAKMVQRPEIETTLSGRLKLSGRISHPDITGKLVIDRAEILPDNMVLAKPPLLTDFDIYEKTNTVLKAKARKPLPFGMDVRIEMPDQVYVNASLIDSVWGGALRVRDTHSGLSIKGKVEPRRGYVNFIGKKFRFKQGFVEFDGAIPTSPVLNNLTAEYSRSDVTARLVLNGKLSDPRYILESTPAMPQDEVISYVLFNRDTTSISPYQAFQIAAAAQQLSGGLSGPGFMYQFRKAVRIDTLEWREPDTEGGSSSVAAGKYITSGLYFEVNSTVGEQAETGVTAEYDINRHISVDTSMGSEMRPGIGINWKTDY